MLFYVSVNTAKNIFIVFDGPGQEKNLIIPQMRLPTSLSFQLPIFVY